MQDTTNAQRQPRRCHDSAEVRAMLRRIPAAQPSALGSRDEWRDALTECRTRRASDALAERHERERAALRDALTDAAEGSRRQARKRVQAERDALAGRHRDEWRDAHSAPVTAEQALWRILEAAARVTGCQPDALTDDAQDAAAAVLHRLARRHGWHGIPAHCLSADYLRTAVAGVMSNAAERARRTLSLREGEAERDAWSAQDHAARNAAIRRNVWALAELPTDDAAALAAGTGAAQLPPVDADALADALSAVDTGRPLTQRERLAVGAAVNGYGDATALAQATGRTPGAIHKALSLGRVALAERYGDRDALADALADAARVLAERDRTRPALRRDERAAAQAVERVRLSGYRQPGRPASPSAHADPLRQPVTVPLSPALTLAVLRSGNVTAALALRWSLRGISAARQSWQDRARVKPYRPASRLRVTVPVPPATNGTAREVLDYLRYVGAPTLSARG